MAQHGACSEMLWRRSTSLATSKHRRDGAKPDRIGAIQLVVPDIYAYVGNDPINLTDPSGLCAGNGCGNANPANQLIQNDAITPVYPLEYAIGAVTGGSALRTLGSAIVRQFLPDSPTQYNLTQTVQNNASSRPYVNSPLTVQEITATGKGVPDPGGLPGALRYDVPGTMSRPGAAVGDPNPTVRGTYELVIDPKTNTVYHFLFRSGQ